MQEDIIAISHLTKNYGRFMALKDINLTMKSGRIIGLLGPNGSGKTTLIKILNGLLANYQGTIQIAQENLGTHAKSLISYLPDEPYFEDWMYAKDALSLFNDMYSDFDLTKCLNLMERFDLKKDMRIKSMSKGMKEKFQFLKTIQPQHRRSCVMYDLLRLLPTADSFVLLIPIFTTSHYL